ncbi:MAG: glycosyltransferase family 39 protein [Bacteroidales bacterium]|nr:MAG: glycosyltransferase family 39 protein [Bacteroidales bacterium]
MKNSMTLKWIKRDFAFYMVVFLSLFNVVFHIIIYRNLEYHRDELLYFSLGTHPAAGYATTPPLIGLLSFLLIKVLGYSQFAAKILPALFSGVIVYLSASITRELGGKSYARILTGTAIIITPFCMRTFTLFQPVFLDLFFWTLIFYYLLRYMNTGNDRYLFILGIVAGFGLLNKYLIALQLAGMVLLLPFTKYRPVFSNRFLYFGGVVAILLFLPNIIWQLNYDLPVVYHMTALRDTQLVHVSRTGFLIEQLLMPYMATLLVIPGLVYLLVSKHMKDFRLIAYTSVFVMFVLLMLRGKGYYTMGVFPVLIGAGAIFWENIMKRQVLRYGIIILMVLFTLPVIPLGVPVYKAEGMVQYFEKLENEYNLDVGRRWEDGTIHPLPQDYADMLGWEELARIAKQAYDSVENKRSCVIYCQNYGQAGAVSVIGKKYGLPEALSLNDSYRYWLPEKLDYETEALIYIGTEPNDDVLELFADIVEIGRISHPYAREFGTQAYLCREPVRSFNQFYYELLVERGIVGE